MKKIHTFILFSLLIVISSMNISSVMAAPLNQQAVLTFEDLGLASDLVLRGPYGSGSIRFDLPASWLLTSGVELELELSAFIVVDGNASRDLSSNYLGAMLDVYFDDHLQQSIPLTAGENMIFRVPISAEDMVSPYDGGWHKISFFLDAAVDCDFDFHQTTVVIRSTSRVFLPYAEVAPRMDLRQLPRPIYQDRAKTPEATMVVIPSAPSEDELQAGLIVMGSFGRMTNGKLPINMITEDKLTSDVQGKLNLIYVGKSDQFPVFHGADLPLPIVSNAFSSAEVKEDDGVMQLFLSPWNNTRVILFVSGNTDKGVVKAAQALSTGNIQTGNLPSYAIVAEVNPILSAGVIAAGVTQITSPEFTLSDLGYSFFTASGIGTNYLTYEFAIPQGQSPSETPYIELKYSNSVLVDTEKSSVVVYLNDVLIGSIKLSDEESSYSSARVNLPLSALRSGVNRIDVEFNLIPLDECSVFSFSSLWVTVYPESALYLPLIPTPNASFTLGDLNAYPYPFANDPTYSTTAFIVPNIDSASWSVAGNIAYDLGAKVGGPILAFDAFFDTQLPEDVKSQNLILIGEPMHLALVAELKDALPAYFEAGSNIAVLESQQVIYRISEDKSLGYLELFTSPQNDQSAILGIFGTTAEGVGYAGKSLLDVKIRDTLAGNFVTLDGDNAIVVDTRTGLGIGRVEPGLGPEIVTSEEFPVVNITPDSRAAQGSLKQLIVFSMAGIIFLMVVVAIIAIGIRKKNL